MLRNFITDRMFKMGWVRLAGLVRVSDEYKAVEAVANTLRREVEAAVSTTSRLRREVDVQTAAAAKLSASTDSDTCLIKELTDKVKVLTQTCDRYSTARHEQDATIAKQLTKINNLQRVIRRVSDDIGATSAEERTV